MFSNSWSSHTQMEQTAQYSILDFQFKKKKQKERERLGRVRTGTDATLVFTIPALDRNICY